MLLEPGRYAILVVQLGYVQPDMERDVFVWLLPLRPDHEHVALDADMEVTRLCFLGQVKEPQLDLRLIILDPPLSGLGAHGWHYGVHEGFRSIPYIANHHDMRGREKKPFMWCILLIDTDAEILKYVPFFQKKEKLEITNCEHT
jgi:hypothetical protein